MRERKALVEKYQVTKFVTQIISLQSDFRLAKKFQV